MSTLRIGTWNLAGRWSSDHEELLLAPDCDVWLLTEVNDRAALDGYHAHLSEMSMAPRRRWAAVFSRQKIDPLPDPHPASAAVQATGVVYCSSVLPWRSCGSRPPWIGERHAAKTAGAVEQLQGALLGRTVVWGGDWNHALTGPESAGSLGGRTSIVDALDSLDLKVPTAQLPHRIDGLLSIDHIALPSGFAVDSVARIQANGLSDHDAYVVAVVGQA